MAAPGETRDTPPLPRRRRWIVLAAIVLLAAVLTGLVLMRPPPDPAEELLDEIRSQYSDAPITVAVRMVKNRLYVGDPWPERGEKICSEIDALGPRAVPALIRGLEDPSHVVRRVSVITLLEMRDATAVPALLNTFKADTDPHVRDVAAQALGDIADPAAVPGLIDVLNDRNLHIEDRAARILGEIADPAAVPALIDALRASDARLRTSAAEALGMIADRRAVPPLIKALGDTDVTVRASAAFALADIGDATQAEHLLPLLNDSDLAVRRRAARGLAMLGRSEGVTFLAEEAAMSWVEPTKASPESVAYLACLNSPEAREALGRLAPDGDLPFIGHLASNMIEMGGVHAFAAQLGRKDNRYTAQLLVAEALVHLADESARSALVEASQREVFVRHGGRDARLQRAARLALRRLDRRAAEAKAAAPQP